MPNPDKKPAPAVERRKKERFAISANFPLKVALALPGENDGAWKDWPGTLVDISAMGAHVQVSLAAIAFPESQCRLKLSLGTFKVEIPGTLAHFICSSRYAVGGMQLYFHDPAVERAYQRVLEPVIIGASLAPVETTQEYSVRFKEEYQGKLSGQLIVWRESSGGAISGFDFRMNRYGAEAEREPGGDPGARLALKFKLATSDDATRALTDAQNLEVRWLYRLSVSNLSPFVAADVRKLLLSLV